MKKIALFGICLLGSMALSAQTNLVKDVERQMKAAPDKFPTNIETLRPAFTNPETAEGAYVWFVAGKGGMDFFDNQQGLLQIGKDVDKKNMGHALMDSYGYLTNALRRDSVADAKGKIKTKYSKDIFKLINNHYNDYNTAAVYLWEAQDYKGAYDAWEMFLNIPVDPVLNGNGPKELADSTMSDIYYNQALAAWQCNDMEKALQSFDKAIDKGYNKKNVFDYAIAVSSGLHDTGAMARYAQMAMPLYGAEDSNYLLYIINDKISKEQYTEAQELLKNYLETDPNNAQIYFALGYLYDAQQNIEEAKDNYSKAIAINPDHVQANMGYGRQLYNTALLLDATGDNMTTPEYNKLRAEQVNPLFQQAVPYLEKAYQLDPDNTREALNVLRNIYYNLNDAANLQRIETLLSTY